MTVDEARLDTKILLACNDNHPYLWSGDTGDPYSMPPFRGAEVGGFRDSLSQ